MVACRSWRCVPANVDLQYMLVVDALPTIQPLMQRQDALEVHALAMQAAHGDASMDCESSKEEDRLRWEAWSAIKGLEMHEAKRSLVSFVDKKVDQVISACSHKSGNGVDTSDCKVTWPWERYGVRH